MSLASDNMMQQRTQDRVSRIRSGVVGFDEMMGGGLPGDAIVMLGGQLGSGRTTLALQIAHEVAKRSRRKCLYASFFESKQTLFEGSLAFGWDFQELEKDDVVRFIEARVADSEDLQENLSLLLDAAAEFKPAIVIIDSLSAVISSLPSGTDLRPFVYGLYKAFHRMKTLAILIVDMDWDDRNISLDIARFGDGIILMESFYDQNQNMKRYLRIPKMYGSDHTRDSVPYEIGKTGLLILTGSGG